MPKPVRDLRRAPVVSSAARTHFALWRIWLCALTTSLPCGVRPLVLTGFSTSLKPPSAPARTTIPPTTSSGLPMTATRFRWQLPGDDRAERGHHRGPQGGQGRARISLSGHFRPDVQATIQSRRLCPGEERRVREWPAEDRVIPGNPRGDEATADCHR